MDLEERLNDPVATFAMSQMATSRTFSLLLNETEPLNPNNHLLSKLWVAYLYVAQYIANIR